MASGGYSGGTMSIDLSQFAAVFLDLDGTIYHEDHPLPGAIELIRALEAREILFACLTNSTSSPERISARLANMGVRVPAGHIHTAARAAVDHVLERFGPQPHVFNLSTDGVQQMLEGKVHWVERRDEKCDAIIVGALANVHATADRQKTALYLARQGAQLVGICADRTFPSKQGLEFGAGAQTEMLAYASGTTPIYCGKPQPSFFAGLCARLGVDATKCVLIGDNVEADIAGAHGVGMQAILTLTGITEGHQVDGLRGAQRPDAVIDDLGDLLRPLQK